MKVLWIESVQMVTFSLLHVKGSKTSFRSFFCFQVKECFGFPLQIYKGRFAIND
jgi:hypothetical protein